MSKTSWGIWREHCMHIKAHVMKAHAINRVIRNASNQSSGPSGSLHEMKTEKRKRSKPLTNGVLQTAPRIGHSSASMAPHIFIGQIVPARPAEEEEEEDPSTTIFVCNFDKSSLKLAMASHI